MGKTIHDHKFVRNYASEKRKEIVKLLIDTEKIRREQLLIFEEMARPVKDMIKISEQTRKNQFPLDVYLERNKAVSEYIMLLGKVSKQMVKKN